MKPRKSILVVEDDTSVIENFYKRSLSSLDVDVDYAQSKQEAIEKVRNKIYSIAIVDIMLQPNNIRDRGGLDLIKYINRLNQRTVVIVVTASQDINVAVESNKMGIFDFIQKENIKSSKDIIAPIESILEKLPQRKSKDMLQAGVRINRAKTFAEYWMPETDTQTRFERLSTTWREKAAYLSSPVEIAMLPEYQEIIGMGATALPFILHELENEPDHWFWALRAITGINPVSQDDTGKIDKMTQTWIEWAREKGIIK